MKSFTRDAPPDPVLADQVAAGAPAAGKARGTARTRIARLARFTAEIAEILVGFPGC